MASFQVLDFPMGRTYAIPWLCPLNFEKYEPVRSALKAQHSDWECGHELSTWRQMWDLNHEFWSYATPLTHPWKPFESCRAWGKLTLCLALPHPRHYHVHVSSFQAVFRRGTWQGRAWFSFCLWSFFTLLSVGGVCPETLGGSFRTFLEHRQFLLLVPCFYNWNLNLLWRVRK